jgi:hypothetical protein
MRLKEGPAACFMANWAMPLGRQQADSLALQRPYGIRVLHLESRTLPLGKCLR